MLSPATERLWGFLKDQSTLTGFVLIGGSALSLRIHHRLSEDLDFAWPGDRLPRESIQALLGEMSRHGFSYTRRDNPAAYDEFLQGGGSLHDYQQDFVVDGAVLLTLFAPDPPTRRLFDPATPHVTGPRLATLRECFNTKALASSERNQSRDWLDLYLLIKSHGFTLDDYRAAFERAGASGQFDRGLTHLCRCQPGANDRGYNTLLADPPTFQEIAAQFTAWRDDYEVGQASLLASKLKEHAGTDLYDLAYAKLVGGSEEDLRFVATLASQKRLDPVQMAARIDQTQEPGLRTLLKSRWLHLPVA